MFQQLTFVGVIAALLLSGLAFFSSGSNSGVGTYVASDTTTITNPWTFSSTVGVTGATTLTGDVTFSGDLSSGIATTSTTTIELGKICYSFTTNTGVDLYGFYGAGGVFATSSTSCN